MIAEILGCKFTLSISESEVTPMGDVMSDARDITVGELADIADDVTEVQVEPIEEITKEALPVPDVTETEEKQILRQGIKGYFRKGSLEPGTVAKEEQQVVGEINPYTRKEYESNSVRMHPKKIGYVQVYDREQHKWTDMTEWAFLGYQERKKQLLGKDYKPPIYLD